MPDGRTARKRQAIIQAATAAFLRSGYRGTNMDEIAREAGVSKQTVYKHFADKHTLFSEMVQTTVERVAGPVAADVARLRDSGRIEADLVDLARRQLAAVLRPELLALRRLVIAEAGRFPELGRVFYEQGPARTIAALASALAEVADRRLLAIDDAHLAATRFNWLIMAQPLNEAMFLGRTPNAVEIRRLARQGVAAFLAIYPPMAPSEPE